MRNRIASVITVLLFLPLVGKSGTETVIQLSEHVSLIPGPVNGVSIEKDNARLVVYGDPSGKIEDAEMVLFTHSRRDVVWAGRKLVGKGTKAVVPEGDVGNFTNVEQFWNEFKTRRFHDYAQQGTKIPTKSLKIDRTIKAGDNFSWRGIPSKLLILPATLARLFHI